MYSGENNRLAAVEAILADFSIKMQEMREYQAETGRQRREYQAETEKQMREAEKQMRETDKRLRILTEQVTGISKSNGLFSEDYFLNSFKKDDLNFFGEKFDRIIKGKGNIVNDEYDFVLLNGNIACIVEVKYKARREDIAKALKKPATFRINFPEYQNHKIFLAIAALSINETLENECRKQGIAVIKQEGDKVIVYDENLKEF